MLETMNIILEAIKIMLETINMLETLNIIFKTIYYLRNLQIIGNLKNFKYNKIK